MTVDRRAEYNTRKVEQFRAQVEEVENKLSVTTRADLKAARDDVWELRGARDRSMKAQREAEAEARQRQRARCRACALSTRSGACRLR